MNKVKELNPNKSLKSQLFLNFITPIIILGVLVFVFVKILSSHIINDYVLPQFEQILQTNGEELVRSIDVEEVNEVINNPEANPSGIINSLDAFMEGEERLEYAYILTKKADTDYIVGLNGSEDVMIESPFTDEQNQAFNNDEVVVTSIYEDEWGVHKSIFIPMENSEAIVGVDMSTQFVTDLQRNINFFLIAFLVVALILGALLAYLYGNKLNRTVTSLLKSINRVSDGDLTAQVQVDRKDEIGQLADSINKMKDNLKSLVGGVLDSSNQVTAQGEELTQSANEVREGNQQVASTMQEISSGAEAQADSSTDLSEIMKGFARKIEEANENGKSISSTSKEVLAMSDEGQSMMQESVHQMNTINMIVKESVGKVRGLDQQSQEITKLVQVIENIADQTNLLSLNAAIEAARAGEHGKGFAVVADEVRKLAEQVSHSIVDITSIVDKIKTESSLVADSLDAGYMEVEQGSKQIEETGRTFNSIHSSVSEMAGRIQGIASHLTDIANDSQKMDTSIEEIASVSEEAAAGVQQVAASTQQSISSMEEVSNSASQLSELADDLNKQVRKFMI
ncbi:methyl-accepting chemotaxis protein [Halobacillus dabanensis]|uniref:Methyl-accepting chemotaxis protein n=1 Tax=Halobacillus dabanensis TaxID=240302 RepID=A0A1I3UG80_HALDA|nr:HAMP domain-containing methyl-accepting chemotaxis protein [Halobacillus dabanensis]SFJ82484.1 methyl-accepting chemotaxis protein [Halobacillus dabanensis]